MVWHGIVWCGMARHGTVVWYGMVWYGSVQYIMPLEWSCPDCLTPTLSPTSVLLALGIGFPVFLSMGSMVLGMVPQCRLWQRSFIL